MTRDPSYISDCQWLDALALARPNLLWACPVRAQFTAAYHPPQSPYRRQQQNALTKAIAERQRPGSEPSKQIGVLTLVINYEHPNYLHGDMYLNVGAVPVDLCTRKPLPPTSDFPDLRAVATYRAHIASLRVRIDPANLERTCRTLLDRMGSKLTGCGVDVANQRELVSANL